MHHMCSARPGTAPAPAAAAVNIPKSVICKRQLREAAAAAGCCYEERDYNMCSEQYAYTHIILYRCIYT